MSEYVVLFMVQLLIGSGFGFYMSCSETRVSKTEIKLCLATILFLSGIALFSVEQIGVTTTLAVILSIGSLTGGIMLGEVAHSAVVGRVRQKMDKNRLYRAINDLVQQIERNTGAEDEYEGPSVNWYMHRTLIVLQEAETNAHMLKQDELAQRIRMLSDVCVQFVEAGKGMEQENEHTRQQYLALSRKVKSCAWDTLQKAEIEMERGLLRSWNTFVYAVRTVQMK